METNPHKRVRRLSQPKELTHVANLLDLTIAMALGFSVMAQVIQNDSVVRGR